MGVVAVQTKRGHTLIGSERELQAHLVALVAQGRLNRDGLLAQGRAPDGQCYARVRLVDVTPRRRVRRPLVVTAVVVGVAVTGALVWALVVAVAWVIAHLAAIGAGLVVVAILAGLLLFSGGGRHCPGCRG